MKIKTLQVAGGVLVNLLIRKRIHEIAILPNGLPEDAMIVDVRFVDNILELDIESGEYEDVLDGQMPPVMEPVTIMTASFSRTLSEIAEGMVRQQPTGAMIVLQREDMRKMASIAVGSVLKAIGVLH